MTVALVDYVESHDYHECHMTIMSVSHDYHEWVT